MRKSFLVWLFILTMLVFAPITQANDLESSNEVRVVFSNEEIEKIARQIITNSVQVTELEKIYDQLLPHQQRQLLEMVGEKRGISMSEFGQEIAENVQTTTNSKTMTTTTEIIEQDSVICWSCAYFPYSSWTSWTCDGDPTDLDYRFAVGRPSGSPSEGRASDHLSPSVWAMLAYYQLQNNGIIAHVYTSSVHLCLGETGVSYGGGQAHIEEHLAIYRK